MARKARHPPLRVMLNSRHVGYLRKAASGATEFQYERSWLDWPNTFPVSLSLPLREDQYRGAEVTNVFENLLPDAEPIRRRVAERVGAAGTDAYSLLTAIGRDCVGALQFLTDAEESDPAQQEAEPLTDADIEKLLKGLAQAPLGLTRDDDFRISVAGAQEKTALLFKEGAWFKPHGATPTTHIFKPPIGRLPNGIDLTHSVENEHYCLRLVEAFGLPVNQTQMLTFGETKALVVERFDRRWTSGRLLRLPQEDFCQSLSVPPTRKYQSDGGPTLVDALRLLDGSDNPAEDQAVVLQAQILFWLIGATDGHAKNFSLFLGPGGRYWLTPLYDILTAQPSLDAKQIERRQFRLAMSVGKNRHYLVHEIVGRHFVQTGEAAGLSKKAVMESMTFIADHAEKAIASVEQSLPAGFPLEIHESVSKGLLERRAALALV